MKKLVSFLAVCTVAVTALASCGSSSSEKDEKKEKKEKTPAIVGKWEMAEMAETGVDAGGVIFKEDGKGSMYVEISSMLYIQENGSVNLSGMEIEAENYTFDGETFSLSYSGMDLLEMKKAEKSDESDLNGTYSLEGGLLTDSLKEQFASNEGEDVSIEIELDGQKTELLINDIMTYTYTDDKLTLDGYGKFTGQGEESSEYDYTLDGDSLTLKNDEETLNLTRVK